jgi:hypothetical protein
MTRTIIRFNPVCSTHAHAKRLPRKRLRSSGVSFHYRMVIDTTPVQFPETAFTCPHHEQWPQTHSSTLRDFPRGMALQGHPLLGDGVSQVRAWWQLRLVFGGLSIERLDDNYVERELLLIKLKA